MNDYYYSDAETPEIQPEAEIGSYYNAEPLTRHQYLQCADFREMRMFLRFAGIVIGIFIAIDIFRLYVYNLDFEIYEYMSSIGISLFLIAVFEVLIQLFAFRWCAIAENVLCFFMILIGYPLMLSVVPIGTFMLLACASHIGQTTSFENKYKHYLATNSN